MTVKHTEQVTFSPDLLSLPFTPDQAENALISILIESKLLYTLILHYEYGKGNIQNVQLIKDSINFETDSSGTLAVGYDINEFSVCAAIDYTGQYKMLLHFVLDPLNLSLLLTGEERYE